MQIIMIYIRLSIEALLETKTSAYLKWLDF